MSFVHERLCAALADRYQVERELARGGMAVVYLAHDLRHDRPVAVKVLDPAVAADLGRERFLFEIRVAGKLNHPHILPLYDSGEAAGLLYYVTPFVAGDSLRHRLDRDRQLPVAEALEIAREVCGALHYAHERGVVHRDIKPENILLSEGHAVVADFGIARAIAAAGEPSITSAGHVLGTPVYMSPEQITSEAPPDGRSDVYSLACVLFEMLAGSPPHSGPSDQVVMARKTFEPPPRLRPLRDTVPSSVEGAVLRALARCPVDRFASAAEFGAALRDGTAAIGIGEGATLARGLPSVALLPFRNLGHDEGDEFLGDGVCEELIHALAQVDGLRVVARASTFAFKGGTHDLREIGARLNVSHVVEGTLRRAGERMRLTVHLLSVADGYEIWSGRFDRQFTDVLEVQDEIARTVVDKLKVELLGSPFPAVVTPPANFAAYEDYLRGRYHWNQRTPAGMERGVECFKRALEGDPRYAPAHAALAACWATLGLYGVAAPRVVMPRAREAAERALALDESRAEALAARACAAIIHDRDLPAAELDFKRAIVGDPRSPLPYVWQGVILFTPQRRYAEATAALERARGLDPLSPVLNVGIALVDYYRRDFESALRKLGEVLDLDDGFGLAHHFVGRCLTALGRHAEAVTSFERACELTGDHPESTAGIACALARDGRPGPARARLDALMARARERYVSSALLAEVHAALGERDAALGCLEVACEERAAELAWIDVRPGLDPLRALPRFALIAERCHMSGRDPTTPVGA